LTRVWPVDCLSDADTWRRCSGSSSPIWCALVQGWSATLTGRAAMVRRGSGGDGTAVQICEDDGGAKVETFSDLVCVFCMVVNEGWRWWWNDGGRTPASCWWLLLCERRGAVVAGDEMAWWWCSGGRRDEEVWRRLPWWWKERRKLGLGFHFGRWWRGRIWLVNLVSGGLWHVSAYGWPDLKGGDCHMA